MKKTFCNTIFLVLLLGINNTNAQSVFLQQYNHLPLKKIIYTNNNILATDGFSFYVDDKNGNSISSTSLGLSNSYLLQNVVSTSDGNIFCLYQYTAESSGAGMVVLSLDANLNFRWMKNIYASGSTFGYGMTSSEDNGVVICGTTCSAGFFLLKLNSEGSQVFIKNVNLSGFCTPYSICRYKSNQYAIATRMQSGTDNVAIFISDNAGNVQNARSIAFSNSIYIKSIKADADGNIFSLVNENDGTSDVIKLSANLSDNTIYHITSSNQSIQLNDLAYANTTIVSVGNINIGGSSNLDILTLAINTNNNGITSKTSGNTNGNIGYDDAYSIVTDNEQRFFMSGTSALDGYIAKVNSGMQGFCNAKDINLQTNLLSKAIVNVDYSDNDGVLFNVESQQASSSKGTNANAGFCDYQEITDETSGVVEADVYKNDVNIYPNPSFKELNVMVNMDKDLKMECTISDVLGRKLYSSILIGGNNKVDISKLVPGNYYISLYANNQIVTRKFIKAE